MFKKRVKLSSGKDVKRRKLEPEVVDPPKKSPKSIISASDDEDDADDVDEMIIAVNPTKRTQLPNNKTEDGSTDSDEETPPKDSTIITFLNKPKQVGSSGQIKQSKNLHTTILVDYQPDICKDFAKSGFCGYGDNCKFLHSREDFKSGWKLNKDWIQDKEIELEVENEIKDIPFKCVICGNDYQTPVVTSCNHYFCRKCFFQNIKDTGNNKCFICGENTHGTAKIATNLQKLLNKTNSDTPLLCDESRI